MKKLLIMGVLVAHGMNGFYHSEIGDLEKICHKYKTDKAAWGHNYAELYEFYFEPLRNDPIKLLEIGFLLGSSAFVWEEYFPQAELHHLDINRDCLETAKRLSHRSHLHMVDQSSEKELTEFIRAVGGEFDIIIDDGSHIVQHQITSFKVLFPYLRSGGIYVIEDLFSSYWVQYGGGGSKGRPVASPQSTIRFLQGLIDDVNYIGARRAYANLANCDKAFVDSLSYYQHNIKAMHFYGNMCFIVKR